jgi:hypothetical protein
MILDPNYKARFYLNLDRRTDRREATEQEFAKVGLSAIRVAAHPKETFQFSKSLFDRASRASVAQGFLDMLNYAVASGEEWAELFEDDIVFCPNFHEEMAKLQLPDDWDILYLGGWHVRRPTPVNSTIVRCREILGNHAMIIHQRVYPAVRRSILKPLRSTMAKDHRIATLSNAFNLYATSKNLVTQRPGFSDLSDKHEQYFNDDGTQTFWR